MKTHKPGRRRLIPMRVSIGFREFVLSQLAEIRGLDSRPMFGGLGLYAGDVFFAIVAGDVLFFKVDEVTRAGYEQADSHPFKPYANRPVTMSSYYSVPAAVVEDAAALAQWARRSIVVAVASRATMKGRRKKHDRRVVHRGWSLTSGELGSMMWRHLRKEW